VNLGIGNKRSILVGRNYFSVDHNIAIRLACVQGHVECVKILLQDSRVDPSVELNFAMEYSANEGHIEIVKLLLKDWRHDPFQSSGAIYRACSSNNTTMLRFLLQNSLVLFTGYNARMAIIMASSYGSTECVEILLQDPRIDPAVEDNQPFLRACQYNKLETVKVLLNDPRVDPSDNSNAALATAVENRFNEIKQLLLKDPRVLEKLSSSEDFLEI
jgi:ankyrin repeat protein